MKTLVCGILLLSTAALAQGSREAYDYGLQMNEREETMHNRDLRNLFRKRHLVQWMAMVQADLETIVRTAVALPPMEDFWDENNEYTGAFLMYQYAHAIGRNHKYKVVSFRSCWSDPIVWGKKNILNVCLHYGFFDQEYDELQGERTKKIKEYLR